jgi:2-amino-4-hydroxy-6-hydroxymethyldihydropteridine diphosphokinase
LSASLYLIALGSNQRHPLAGRPSQVIEQAIAALEMPDIDIFAVSPIVTSTPLGPSQRRYANAAAILSSPLAPPALLQQLRAVEAHFGRERRGQKWRARVLDLDIILWSGGIWVSDGPALGIPHAQFRNRRFVLGPAQAIAPDWRDPISNRSIRQLFHGLKRPKPLDRPQQRL